MLSLQAHGRKPLPGQGISGRCALRDNQGLALPGSPRAQKRSLDSGPSELLFPVVKRRLSMKCHPTKSVGLEEKVPGAVECVSVANDAESLIPPSIIPSFPAVEMEDFFSTSSDVPQIRDVDADGITTAVESALQSFDEVSETFTLDHEEDYRDSAFQCLQKRVHEQYEKLCSAFVGLMDETGHDALPEVRLDNVVYDVIRFCGVSGACDTQFSKTQIRAREEVCGLLPVLASRADKSWLSAGALDQNTAKRQGSKLHDNRRDASHSIRLCGALRAKEGSFEHALECPTSTFRIGVIRTGPSPVPASLIVTQHVPLHEALARMDALGSLSQVRALEAYEFALQEKVAGKPAVDSALKELMCSDSPVVMIDIARVLAPREQWCEQALCEIVESELLSILREAKMHGRAVVFALSDDGRADAFEEFIQSPLNAYGMRCGQLRWRNCLDVSHAGGWACNQSAARRTYIGLQFP